MKDISGLQHSTLSHPCWAQERVGCDSHGRRSSRNDTRRRVFNH
ncbi:hypothetical protein FE784_07255 [Paenibacillus hemerocallicola]|uniref:Uncharacterized protein n=1 Tax=Paenibacillus hemerocallicola TaxID=1172614 RepID=A0A5C4TDB3_9BACL|nr:hypothetical protein FE784_07255 [Paenibacillus hemerocallicola]